MKKLLLLAIISISSIAYGQYYIGDSYDSLYEYFRENGVERRTTDGGVPYLIWETDDHIQAYFFDSNGICERTKVYLKENYDLEERIKDFDKRFKRLTGYRWRFERNGKYHYIIFKSEYINGMNLRHFDIL